MNTRIASINKAVAVRDKIIRWIEWYFDTQAAGHSAVIGLSGGKDSTVAAALCVEAIGKERVIGVLMPDGEQSDIDDARGVAEILGIRSVEANIQHITAAFHDVIAEKLPVSERTKQNIPPRVRMTLLYAVAQSLPEGGRVVNTSNFSEAYIGYCTKFGDNAGDFSPLGNLLMHEVIQIGRALGLPERLIVKTPSDGLCGKSDEDNLGFTYEQLDTLIVTGECDDEGAFEKICSMHESSKHKGLDLPKPGV